MADNELQIITPKFRAAFVRVWEPDAFDDSQEAKYSIVMLFPKDTDMTGLKKTAQTAIKNKWGDKKPKGLYSPFRDGDATDDDGELLYPYDGYEGMWIVSATSKWKPGIVDIRRQLITDESQFYSGCWARARVQAFTYDRPKKGVSFGLINLQKLEDDEPFSGRVSAEKDFDDDTSQVAPEAQGFDDLGL